MKRVLIVSCVFVPEPVVSAQISKDIAFELSNLSHNVTVLAPVPSRPAGFDFKEYKKDGGKLFFETILPKVQVLNIKSKTSPNSNIKSRFLESWSFGSRVGEYLNNVAKDFDIVYINSWPIFSQYLISKACVKLGIPYIIHIQDIYPESLSNKLPQFLGLLVNKSLMPFERFYLKRAKKIIVISENMKQQLMTTRGIEDSMFEIVYNWQDEASFEAPSIIHNKKFTFMYLGNIGPVAGVENVIKAFFDAGLKDCELIIAGNGANKASCISLVKEINSTNVKFVDVPNGEVPNTQKLADVLLLPVIKGGANSSIPSKLPAYMFSAKPIIATLDKNTATADAIIDAKCGWVGDAEDRVWLSKQMQFVSNLSKSELDKIGKLGYVYGMANFSKQVNLNKIIDQLINE